MISEKMQHIATVPAVLVAGAMLSFVVDSPAIMYALLVVSALFAAASTWFVTRKQYASHTPFYQVAVTFFSLTSFASLYAAHAFQLISLPIVITGGLLLSVCAGFLWDWPAKMERSSAASLLSLLTFEWFVIFLFAPANYLVLGTLVAIAFVSMARLFEFQLDSGITKRDVARHLIVTLMVALLFILGFKWVL